MPLIILYLFNASNNDEQDIHLFFAHLAHIWPIERTN